MSLREKLSAIKTDQLADLAEIMDLADGIENDLTNANSVIAERDKEIEGLKAQNNKLYARIVLSETGDPNDDDEPESWHDLEGDEAVEAFINEISKEEK